ncbi:MAG: hypothetical protein WC089_00165 [Candidatus Paceibacterota bacterium]
MNFTNQKTEDTLKKKTIKALNWIVNILNEHKIDYVVSGGFSAKLYSSKRELHDIDIDIFENKFDELLSEISKYITYGPDRYKDGKWDMNLITLNYGGQEIDIGDLSDAYISNKERTAWIKLENKLEPVKMTVGGIEVNVINPQDLINYKKNLDGDHQLEDIKSVEAYIKNIML